MLASQQKSLRPWIVTVYAAVGAAFGTYLLVDAFGAEMMRAYPKMAAACGLGPSFLWVFLALRAVTSFGLVIGGIATASKKEIGPIMMHISMLGGVGLWNEPRPGHSPEFLARLLLVLLAPASGFFFYYFGRVTSKPVPQQT